MNNICNEIKLGSRQYCTIGMDLYFYKNQYYNRKEYLKVKLKDYLNEY